MLGAATACGLSKKLFLEISQNLQENTCARVACNFIKKEALAKVFSCEFCEISRNINCYRIPLVAASVNAFHWITNTQKEFIIIIITDWASAST